MKSRISPVNTENKLMNARGEEGGGMGKMGEGETEIQASSCGLSHWDKRHSIRERVNDTVIALYGDRG